MHSSTQELYTAVIVDENISFSAQELSQVCQVEVHVIIEMVEHGLLEPHGNAVNEWQFSAQAFKRSRAALRLQHDLGINVAGAALAVELLEHIEQLQRQIKLLQQHHLTDL